LKIEEKKNIVKNHESGNTVEEKKNGPSSTGETAHFN
jgi:hypothetical protein